MSSASPDLRVRVRPVRVRPCAGVASQLTAGQGSLPSAPAFPTANNNNGTVAFDAFFGATAHHNNHNAVAAFRCYGLDNEDDDEDGEEDAFGNALFGGGGLAAAAAAAGCSPAAYATCKALGGLVARCRPPGSTATAEGDILPLVMAAGAGGGAPAVQRDLEKLMLLSEPQVMDVYKRVRLPAASLPLLPRSRPRSRRVSSQRFASAAPCAVLIVPVCAWARVGCCCVARLQPNGCSGKRKALGTLRSALRPRQVDRTPCVCGVVTVCRRLRS